MSVPRHVLTAILRARGLENPDGVSRRVKATQCRKCRALVLRGLDADRIAAPATVDPTPLTPAGELAAVLAGRHTYGLHPTGGHWELDDRDAWRMRTPPSLERPVHAAHVCGAPPLDHYPATPATKAEEATDACPF